MSKTYCGKTRDEMNDILNFMCELEDKVELTDEEEEKYDVAIQCVATVMNRMIHNRPICFDDEEGE